MNPTPAPPEEQREIVPADITEPADMVPWENAGPTFVTTLEDKNEAIRLKDSATPLGEVLGSVFNLTDLIMHMASLVDEKTGEIVYKKRFVLVADDGSAYATMSAGIEQSIREIVAANGRPPYSPPLPVKAVQHQGKNAHRIYRLLPMTPPAATR